MLTAFHRRHLILSLGRDWKPRAESRCQRQTGDQANCLRKDGERFHFFALHLFLFFDLSFVVSYRATSRCCGDTTTG